jgi:hypothetical protein
MLGRNLSGIVAVLILVPILVLILGSGRVSAADDPALSLADLAAYRAALIDRASSTSEGPPVAVGFRELWSRPEVYQGRQVEVRGRVVRRFRQGSIGTFPPLAEVWAVAPSGDPFCLVFPEPRGKSTSTPAPEPTGTVGFVGTFLKQVRYQGGDGPRLAPLIVGPKPPVALEPAPASSKAPRPDPASSWLEGAIGLVAACFVGLVLARQHLRQPRRSREIDVEPPPFLFDLDSDLTAENAESSERKREQEERIERTGKLNM